MRKVPEITVYFWIIKLLSTAMGEATSDYLVHQINPYFAVALGGIGLAAALVLQFFVRRYVAWIYWLAVVMVAISGTMAADVLHIEFGIPYLVSAAFFALALAVIFMTWYRSEKTLSIHSIDTPRRELFYWATVMATFALGTAVGDMTAITMGLGYFSSGVFFAVLFALPALAYRQLGLNGIIAFWFAYIVTRPLGASFADWAGKPRSLSGLGLGSGQVSIGLTILIVGFVGYLTLTRKDMIGNSA
ncbi:MAG: COG4705 family protein [Chloroflexota bacterium]